MHLETILNRCYKLKGFVYAKAQWKVRNNGEPIIAVQLRRIKKANPSAFFVKNRDHVMIV